MFLNPKHKLNQFTYLIFLSQLQCYWEISYLIVIDLYLENKRKCPSGSDKLKKHNLLFYCKEMSRRNLIAPC